MATSVASFDREKFLKVVRLTASDKDGEVLAAAYRANEILKNAGLSWEQVINYTPKSPLDWTRAKQTQSKSDTFKVAMDAFSDSGLTFETLINYMGQAGENVLRVDGRKSIFYFWPDVLVLKEVPARDRLPRGPIAYGMKQKRATIAQAIYRIKKERGEA